MSTGRELSAARKRELLARVDALDGRLARAGAERSELSPVTSALFFVPAPWPERLDRARRLAAALPGSWLKDRSGKVRAALPEVRRVLGEVLVPEADEEEVRFVLGWLLRRARMRSGVRR